MIRADSGKVRKYILNAPQIVVDIASSGSGVFGSSGIEYLTAGENAEIIVTPVNSMAELARFTASRIKYNEMAESIIADGPCEFNFYANDFMPAHALGSAVPVQIHAKDRTTFLPAQNQLIFEGDCICTMVRSKDDLQNKYTLAAPKITIDLSTQDRQDMAVSALGIERFTADAGLVQISNVKTQMNQLVGFNKIKCQQFVYDTQEKLFTAAGPGLITVDNSRIDEPPQPTNKFSIRKKCYAFLRDFETLKFDLATNLITAKNDENKILADYFPIVNDEDEQQIKASAGAVKIELISNEENNRSEISMLRAFNGITYEDAENHFIAAEMSYDAETALLRAGGDEFHRCYLNGVVVDNIVYNVNEAALVNVDMLDPVRVRTTE